MKYSILLTIGGILMSFAYLNVAQQCACGEDADGDGYCSTEDCDDTDASVYPDAVELCDSLDNDCNGLIDDAADNDGDGFSECSDCDDGSPDAYPGAEELCNGLDDNCDSSIPLSEQDLDGDGFAVCDGDCNDDAADTYPDAPEICDGLDNDCDGAVATSEADVDNDGYAQCDGDCDDINDQIGPEAEEICDGIDQDCDGLIDVASDGALGWVRTVCGAVLSPTIGTYDAQGVDQACIFYNSDLDLYQAWYRSTDSSGVKRIGYAESTDTISWTKIPGAVLDVGEESDDWDVALLGFPTVIHRSGQYLMWYQGQDKSNLIRIGFATSNDGVNWVKYAGNPVLDLGEVGAWDSRVVQAPSVVYDSNDEMYKMWFTGGDGEYFQTGYATSTDGRNWTKSDSNPVVQVGVSGAWDSKRVVFARVHYFDGKYSMWYSGEDIDNMYSYEIGYATAIDEENWAKSPENPILSYTGDGSFDSYMVYAADVIELSDGFAMYYSGAAQSVGPYRIGIAKNDVPSASILAPAADSIFRSGDRIDFSVYAFDSGGSEGVMVRYYSNIDGYLGSAKTDYEGFALFSDRHLSVGTHSITIHVSGSGGIGKYLTAEIAVYD